MRNRAMRNRAMRNRAMRNRAMRNRAVATLANVVSNSFCASYRARSKCGRMWNTRILAMKPIRAV